MKNQKSKVLRLTESEMISLIERIIEEQYFDSEKLYSRDYIISRLERGPKELKKFIKHLPYIECADKDGNSHVCTKIPEVIHVFLKGRY